jgi:hypothetical protein
MKNYYKFLFTFSSFLGLLTISFTLLVGNAFADPNVILGGAIKNAAKLKGNLPTKERLKAYENIFKALDKIVAEHPSSDQAIKILSDQKIGNFNAPTLRNAYIKDLTGYYDTVCEVSPSYSCLGFVSLKTGSKQCKTSKDFEGVVEAHLNLKNAARVFMGQKDSNSYIPLAMDSYRSCLSKSSFEPTKFANDFFTFELITLLLESKQESLAKASIENMTTPYFKFMAVLKLSAYSKKKHDKAFGKRLGKYIGKKLPRGTKNEAAALAGIALSIDRMDRSNLPIETIGVSIDTDLKNANNECDLFLAERLFDQVTIYHSKAVGLKKSRKKFNNNDIARSANFVKDRSQPLKACHDKESGLFNYGQMIELHARLLMMDPWLAKEFKRRAISEFWTSRQQTEHFFNIIGEDKKLIEKMAKDLLADTELGLAAKASKKQDDMNASPMQLCQKMVTSGEYEGGMMKCFKEMEAKEKSAKTPMQSTSGAHNLEGANFYVYKKLVDHGNVCDSTAILFKQLKGGSDYDNAIQHMVESPKVDPNKKYNCGDEDLELLLQ